MEERLTLSGKWKFTLTDVEGNEKKIVVPNLITTVGKYAVAKILSLEVATELFQFIAFGDGSTAPAIGDTTLESELARVAPDAITRTNNVVTVQGEAGNDIMNGFTIQEIGIFGIDATSSVDTGDMLSRALISPAIVKNATIKIQATYELTIN